MSRRRPPSYRVFISHSTKDKWIAIQLSKIIEGAGFMVFRDDRDMQGGTKLAEEVRQQLQDSDEVLVLWTPQAAQSRWVDTEVSMAFGMKLHIVAIRYLADVNTLPVCIGGTQSPELAEAEVEKYLKDLARRAEKRRG